MAEGGNHIIINKTFTQEDIETYIAHSQTVKELRELVDLLTKQGLITTATGHLSRSNLSEKFPYNNTAYNMRAWEYCRVYDILALKPSMRVLDCGGASSPLVFLGAHNGVDITTIDLQEPLVANTLHVARRMGWKIQAFTQDLTETSFPDNHFDAITCISVLEHMNNDLKAKAMSEFGRILKPGGLVGLTFDFGRSINAKSSYDYDKHNQFHTPLRSVDEIRKYLIDPSGLEVYGNTEFPDKIDSDRKFIRQVWIKQSISGCEPFKDLARLIYAYSPFFDSPYLHYTFFSLFLRKPECPSTEQPG